MRVIFFTLVILTLAMALSLPLSTTTQAAYISSLEPSRGTVGQTVELTGGVTCGKNYQVYWDSSNTPANLLAQGKSSAGCTIFIELIIPQSVKGTHKIVLRDEYLGEEISHDFTVLPSIVATPLSGTTGTTISITGTGFTTSESDIKMLYDEATVKSGISADDKGRWTATFDIPESARGEHVIQASGSGTTATEVNPSLYTVTPKFSIEPDSGGTGMTITAAGTGFGANEKDIKISFDGVLVKTSVNANNLGSFNTTFTIPTAIKGEHIIDVAGNITKATEVPNLTFTIAPSLLVQPTAGHVDEKITINGSGFAANENEIKIAYDGSEMVSGITADANGAWMATFTVPPSSAGNHPITASGAATPAKLVTSPSFTILPQLVLNPTAGGVGTQIVATGTGFGISQPVATNYDDIKINLNTATDSKGSFSATFKAPATFGANHIVSVEDNAGNRVTASFTTEVAPPPVPTPTSPPADTRIGFVGKQVITFQWSEVTDPSGVSYILEISDQSDFQSPIIHYKDLIKIEYTLTKDEALDYGKYYWRVKAVDGSFNESEWTAAQSFTINRLKTSVFFIIIAAAALIVFLIIWRIISISKRGGWTDEY